MGLFKFSGNAYIEIKEDNKNVKVVKKEDWGKFNSLVLGCGDISKKSEVKSVLCSIFDLEGFTSFCKQIDPQLAVPVFLNKYLEWFFNMIKKETLQKEYNAGISTWHDLPFLIKFMGDGLLVLWDISETKINKQMNIIVSCDNITEKYVTDFLPLINRAVVDPPSKLRCGITKGNVFSIGDGNDFVGPCINFSSRLQKLPGVTVAFSNRGLDISVNDYLKNNYIEKRIEVRGIGNAELVCIMEKEFERMEDKDKMFYNDI
jgi:hypothetical protein